MGRLVGYGVSQVPTNGMLGGMAYQDPINVTVNNISISGAYVSGNLGAGTTNPTSKLTVVGDVLVSGVLTARNLVGTSLSISGISTIANFLMTPVGTGATVGGVGIVTYYGDGRNLTNIVSGYATDAGIATNVIGGIASVTSLNVTGITTLASIVGTSLSISGISTLGITSTTNLTSQQLRVTGITTLASIVGTSLSITGISTIANFRITPIGTGATVGGIGVVTYYGDGSNLSGVSAFSVQQQDITTSPVYPTFASNIGTSSLGIASTQFVYIPASGNIGIGTTTPTSKLTVVGDVLVSGVLTATRLYSGIYGEFVGGSISGSDIVGTSLSITGISTLGSVRISSGIITATTGIVTYYGDGRNLTNVVGAFGGIGTAGGTVGTGITFLDFRGAGISSITSSAGIATITIPGSSRTVSTYTSTAGRTSFDATYTVGYVDVYLNGAKLSSAEYTATDGTTVNLIEGASLNDIVEIVGYSINITGETSISPVMMGMIF